MIFYTKQKGKKENIFVAEVGSILFEFRVDEMDVKVRVNGVGVGKVGGENDSNPCVVSGRQSEPENASVSDGLDKDESVKAVISGKVCNDVLGGYLNLGSRHIAEILLGCGSHVPKSDKDAIVKSNRPLEESISPGCVIDKSRSLGHGSVEDCLSLVEGNESVCERVDSLEKLDCFVDEDVKQSTLKLMRLRRWSLISQKKVSQANPKISGDRSMGVCFRLLLRFQRIPLVSVLHFAQLDLVLFGQIFEVFEEVYSACFLWRSLTLNVVKDQS
ncbi:hypothetical protein V6N11_055598 [Hibiscus sabdariffa]|uniref:Uncharacterized protein n=1 Tax=Hibiscus sabdariffa TaxID=183260 RepID=A0ABR2NR13_9ROSI